MITGKFRAALPDQVAQHRQYYNFEYTLTLFKVVYDIGVHLNNGAAPIFVY